MSPETVHAKPSGTPSACFHYWLGLKSEPRRLTAWASHGSWATLFQTAIGPKKMLLSFRLRGPPVWVEAYYFFREQKTIWSGGKCYGFLWLSLIGSNNCVDNTTIMPPSFAVYRGSTVLGRNALELKTRTSVKRIVYQVAQFSANCNKDISVRVNTWDSRYLQYTYFPHML